MTNVVRARLRKSLGALAIVAACALAVVTLGGDRWAGTRVVTDGITLLPHDAAEVASRWHWIDTGPPPPPVPASDVASPAFSGVPAEILFSVRTEASGQDLYRCRRVGRGFSEPEILFELNSEADEVDPVLIEGGARLVFSSNRAGGQGGFDFWVADRAGEGFTAPRPWDAPLCGPADERHLTTDGDGHRWVFASNRLSDNGTANDLFQSDFNGMTWTAPRLLDTLAAPRGAENRAPALSPDGHFLAFASNRPAGQGGYDLYRSFIHAGRWRVPEPIAALNTAADETDPAFSPEGALLLFVRRDAASALDAHFVAAERRELVTVFDLDAVFLSRVVTVLMGLVLTFLSTWLFLKWEHLHPFVKFLIFSLIVHILILLNLRSSAGAKSDPPERDQAYQVSLLGGGDGDPVPSSKGGGMAQGDSLQDEGRTEASGPATAWTASTTEGPSADGAPDLAVSRVSKGTGQDAAVERSEPRRSVSAEEVAAHGDTSTAKEERSTKDGADTSPGESQARGLQARGLASSARPSRGAGSATMSAPDADAGGALSGGEAGGAVTSLASGRRTSGVATERAGGREIDSRSGAPAPGLAGAGGTDSETAAGIPKSGSDGDGFSGGPGARSFPAESGGLAGTGSGPRRSGVSDGVAAAGSEPSGTGDLLGSRAGSGRPGIAAGVGRGPVARLAGPGTSHVSTGTRAQEDAVAGPRLPEGEPMGRVEARGFGMERPGAARDGASGVSSRSRALSSERPYSEIPSSDLLGARRGNVKDAPTNAAPTTAYAQRVGAARIEALQRGGGTDETEAAVMSGLRYLKSRQRKNGSFANRSQHEKYGDFRVGKTGLALLAFLGSGYTQATQSEFQATVASGLSFILGQQDRRTGHFGDSEGYGHGIATYALAEVYAMTKDPKLEAPLKWAVLRILEAQNNEAQGRLRGGWSYYYRDPERSFDRWPRLSVTVWQIMALKSASLSGIEVPDEAFAAARDFVLGSFDDELGAFRYNHDPAWLASSYPTLPGSNGATLFSLSLLGVPKDDPRFEAVVGYVKVRRPAPEWRRYSNREFAVKGLGNLYYLYYASLGMFFLGGEEWRQWNGEMTRLLVSSQGQDGSWLPTEYYAEYCNDTDQDRIYTTALSVLTLEVYYRYFTPLLTSVATAGKPR